MHSLDLSDNTILVPVGRSLTIQDTGTGYCAQEAHYLYFRDTPQENGARFRPVLAVLLAGRVRRDGTPVEVERVELDFPHRAYGRKVLEGIATYADGVKEDWRIQVDPVHMRIDWIRQPHDLCEPLYYRVLLARRSGPFQFWHTGNGAQISQRDIAVDATRTLKSASETEALFYSTLPRNCFRLELASGGTLEVRGVSNLPRQMPGEPGWDNAPEGAPDEPLWEMTWYAETAAMVRLAGSWGVVPAAWDYQGAQPFCPVDASADFGSFYAQMYLGCLPLNLRPLPEGGFQVRSSVLGTGQEAGDGAAPLREIAWAGEFLYLLEPRAIADLLRAALELTIKQWAGALNDEDQALLLLLAGRFHLLTGDTAILLEHLRTLRNCGEHLLSLRRPLEAMPVVHHTWDPQGVIQGKEPYFVALCCIGLQRLAAMEEALGGHAEARRWLEAANAMKFAALSPHSDGGLWNPENKVFVNYLDFRDPELASPHDQNWARSVLQQKAVARKEYVHYETILPFWMGLIEDDALIRAGYEWIDGRYSYASGRGGVTFPPCAYRNFVCMVDVCVRQKHGVPGAARLLQLILDHAYEEGIPLPKAAFGGHGTAGACLGDPLGSSGQFWDNSPYFALVLHIHYGLDYTHEGWHIGLPRPIENYPMTRVTNLRHHFAEYAVTWQGRGRVKRITVDGKTCHDNVLRAKEGEHEVVVYLS